MNNLTLLMWISLIVILLIRAGMTVDDPLDLCETACQTNTYSDCPKDDSFTYNTTIDCPSSSGNFCKLAFVAAADNEAIDLVCRITVNNQSATQNAPIIEVEQAVTAPDIQIVSESQATVEPNNLVEEGNKENNVAVTEAASSGHTVPTESLSTDAAAEDMPSPPTVQEISLDPLHTVIATTAASQTEVNVDYINDQAAGSVRHQDTNEIGVETEEGVKEVAKMSESKDAAEEDPQINLIEMPETSATVIVESTPLDEPFTCFACSSIDDGPACLVKPEKHVQCKAADKRKNGCFTLYKDGQMERGCFAELNSSQLDACSNDRSCMLCYECNCNTHELRGTHRCHQCFATESCNVKQSAEGGFNCPLNGLNGGCFLYADQENNMHRGCVSSTKDYLQCLAMGTRRCLVCNDRDACNSAALMSEPQLLCSHCDSRLKRSSQDAFSCAWAQTSATFHKCQSAYPYYLEESCEMMFEADTALAVRGCTLDLGACEPTNPYCQQCTLPGCNAVNLKQQDCLQCASDVEARCAVDVGNLKAHPCATRSSMTYKQRGCYTKLDPETNITTRGCQIELTEQGLTFCKQNPKLCILCYDNACNNKLAPSSASKVAFYSPANGFLFVTLVITSLAQTLYFQ